MKPGKMENLSMSGLALKSIFSIRITLKRLKSAQWKEVVRADDRRVSGAGSIQQEKPFQLAERLLGAPVFFGIDDGSS